MELTITEEQERRRIAAELHDNAAQSLAFARMQLVSAEKDVAGTPAAEKLSDLSQLLKDSLHQIREVLLDLSSPALHEIGLAAALSEWLEEQAGRRHSLQTAFVDETDSPSLTHDTRAMLYRNVRELLTNVIKHADAKKVAVRMESSENELRIIVEDDGRGFDPEVVSQRPSGEGAFGLFSIRERMFDMGGSLEIISAPEKGCKAVLCVPLEGEGKGVENDR
jgi:signal transduction histidine kinase